MMDDFNDAEQDWFSDVIDETNKSGIFAPESPSGGGGRAESRLSDFHTLNVPVDEGFFTGVDLDATINGATDASISLPSSSNAPMFSASDGGALTSGTFDTSFPQPFQNTPMRDGGVSVASATANLSMQQMHQFGMSSSFNSSSLVDCQPSTSTEPQSSVLEFGEVSIINTQNLQQSQPQQQYVQQQHQFHNAGTVEQQHQQQHERWQSQQQSVYHSETIQQQQQYYQPLPQQQPQQNQQQLQHQQQQQQSLPQHQHLRSLSGQKSMRTQNFYQEPSLQQQQQQSQQQNIGNAGSYSTVYQLNCQSQNSSTQQSYASYADVQQQPSQQQMSYNNQLYQPQIISSQNESECFADVMLQQSQQQQLQQSLQQQQHNAMLASQPQQSHSQMASTSLPSSSQSSQLQFIESQQPPQLQQQQHQQQNDQFFQPSVQIPSQPPQSLPSQQQQQQQQLLAMDMPSQAGLQAPLASRITGRRASRSTARRQSKQSLLLANGDGVNGSSVASFSTATAGHQNADASTSSSGFTLGAVMQKIFASTGDANAAVRFTPELNAEFLKIVDQHNELREKQEKTGINLNDEIRAAEERIVKLLCAAEPATQSGSKPTASGNSQESISVVQLTPPNAHTTIGTLRGAKTRRPARSTLATQQQAQLNAANNAGMIQRSNEIHDDAGMSTQLQPGDYTTITVPNSEPMVASTALNLNVPYSASTSGIMDGTTTIFAGASVQLSDGNQPIVSTAATSIVVSTKNGNGGGGPVQYILMPNGVELSMSGTQQQPQQQQQQQQQQMLTSQPIILPQQPALQPNGSVGTHGELATLSSSTGTAQPPLVRSRAKPRQNQRQQLLQRIQQQQQQQQQPLELQSSLASSNMPIIGKSKRVSDYAIKLQELQEHRKKLQQQQQQESATPPAPPPACVTIVEVHPLLHGKLSAQNLAQIIPNVALNLNGATTIYVNYEGKQLPIVVHRSTSTNTASVISPGLTTGGSTISSVGYSTVSEPSTLPQCQAQSQEFVGGTMTDQSFQSHLVGTSGVTSTIGTITQPTPIGGRARIGRQRARAGLTTKTTSSTSALSGSTLNVSLSSSTSTTFKPSISSSTMSTLDLDDTIARVVCQQASLAGTSTSASIQSLMNSDNQTYQRGLVNSATISMPFIAVDKETTIGAALQPFSRAQQRRKAKAKVNNVLVSDAVMDNANNMGNMFVENGGMIMNMPMINAFESVNTSVNQMPLQQFRTPSSLRPALPVLPAPVDVGRQIAERRMERTNRLSKYFEEMRQKLTTIDYSTPFVNKGDCLERLLPFAFLNEPNFSDEFLERVDHNLLRQNIVLNQKKNSMENRLASLLLRESVEEHSTRHELNMLLYLDGEYERRLLIDEKEEAARIKGEFATHDSLAKSMDEVLKSSWEETRKFDYDYQPFDEARYLNISPYSSPLRPTLFLHDTDEFDDNDEDESETSSDKQQKDEEEEEDEAEYEEYSTSASSDEAEHEELRILEESFRNANEESKTVNEVGIKFSQEDLISPNEIKAQRIIAYSNSSSGKSSPDPENSIAMKTFGDRLNNIALTSGNKSHDLSNNYKDEPIIKISSSPLIVFDNKELDENVNEPSFQSANVFLADESSKKKLDLEKYSYDKVMGQFEQHNRADDNDKIDTKLSQEKSEKTEVRNTSVKPVKLKIKLGKLETLHKNVNISSAIANENVDYKSDGENRDEESSKAKEERRRRKAEKRERKLRKKEAQLREKREAKCESKRMMLISVTSDDNVKDEADLNTEENLDFYKKSNEQRKANGVSPLKIQSKLGDPLRIDTRDKFAGLSAENYFSPEKCVVNVPRFDNTIVCDTIKDNMEKISAKTPCWRDMSHGITLKLTSTKRNDADSEPQWNHQQNKHVDNVKNASFQISAPNNKDSAANAAPLNSNEKPGGGLSLKLRISKGAFIVDSSNDNVKLKHKRDKSAHKRKHRQIKEEENKEDRNKGQLSNSMANVDENEKKRHKKYDRFVEEIRKENGSMSNGHISPNYNWTNTHQSISQFSQQQQDNVDEYKSYCENRRKEKTRGDKKHRRRKRSKSPLTPDAESEVTSKKLPTLRIRLGRPNDAQFDNGDVRTIAPISTSAEQSHLNFNGFFLQKDFFAFAPTSSASSSMSAGTETLCGNTRFSPCSDDSGDEQLRNRTDQLLTKLKSHV